MKKTIIKTLALAMVISPALTSAATLTRQLELGMRGSDVGTLQTFLAQDATIYPQGLVTDYFGSLTKSAVSNFQSRNGISTVGRVGPQTLGVINSQMNGVMIGTNNNSTNNTSIIGQLSLSASTNQATLSWNTSILTAASVYYSTSPLILTEATENTPFTITGGSITNISNDFNTSHTRTITSLTRNTTYYYVVYVKDAQGNESITLPSTFQTTN